MCGVYVHINHYFRQGVVYHKDYDCGVCSFWACSLLNKRQSCKQAQKVWLVSPACLTGGVAGDGSMICTYTASVTTLLKIATTYLYSPFCAFTPHVHCHTDGQ